MIMATEDKPIRTTVSKPEALRESIAARLKAHDAVVGAMRSSKDPEKATPTKD